MIIDGVRAGRVVHPSSIEELSCVVAEEKGSIVPVGASTQLHFGNPLRSVDCAVDLRNLNRITEYVPGDLTIHVEAGVTLGAIEQALSCNNQFLPLDPWNGPAATIGGIAAANVQGAYRTTGTIRDLIIGMKVVEADGRISKTGGRVVKNVTGYDLAKLYSGSIGTLAVIAEVSMKVRAKYARTATAVTCLPTAAAAEKLLSQIRTGPLQPVACTWLGPENSIRLKFGEHPRAVDWQLRNLPAADWKVVEGPEEESLWAALGATFSAMGPIVIKAIGLPSTTAAIVQDCRPGAWIAHPLSGIVYAAIADPSGIDRCRKTCRVVVECAPLEVRGMVRTFGLNDAEYRLMREMKRAFDPECRLNPGRHVDGERC